MIHSHIIEIDETTIYAQNGQMAEITDYDDNSGKYAICPICDESIHIDSY